MSEAARGVWELGECHGPTPGVQHALAAAEHSSTDCLDGSDGASLF